MPSALPIDGATAVPMRSIRQSLRAQIRLRELEGFTAAKLKRMNAIRGKLRRMSGRRRRAPGLHEFQDHGPAAGGTCGWRRLYRSGSARFRFDLELIVAEFHLPLRPSKIGLGCSR